MRNVINTGLPFMTHHTCHGVYVFTERSSPLGYVMFYSEVLPFIFFC
jgi:hypothetical protein